MQTLWDEKSGRVFAESCMFAGRSRVRLAFPAERVTRVSNSLTGAEYLRGRDWRHHPDSVWLTLGRESEIPVLTRDELHPAGDGLKLYYPGAVSGVNAIPSGRSERNLLFDNQCRFGRGQIEVDYVVAPGVKLPGFPAASPDRLRGLRSRLAAGKGRLKVGAIGDSITLGFNSTGFVGVKPFSPCYAEMFAGELAAVSGLEVTLENFGVNGAGIRWADSIENRYLAEKFDLLIIAYGMNDLTTLTAKEFIGELKGIITHSRAVNPETEYLLVTPMSGNPEWVFTPPRATARIAEALREFARSAPADVALADVHAIWSELLRRKNFFDFTGNGVNHPNDYGHRIYASTLLGAVG